MSKFFAGMLPFEIILLFMGVVVFLALIFLLIYNDLKKEKIVALLPFFLIPVVLVGYPSVQSVQFKDNGLSIEKYARAVAENPNDTAARNALSAKLEEFQNNSSRVRNNPQALTTIADAQLALGNLDSAARTAQMAVSADPHSTEILQTQQKIEHHLTERREFHANIRQLDSDLERLKSNPRDTNVTADITRIMSGIAHPTYMDAGSALVLAKAYTVINQPNQSVDLVDRMLGNDSASSQALQLKNDILTGRTASYPKATPAQQKSFQLNSAVRNLPLTTRITDR